MRYLLDIQPLLWTLTDSTSLGGVARERLEAADAIYVSAAVLCEARMQAEQGKLTLPQGFMAAVAASGFSELIVNWEHVAAMAEVKLPHSEPFDTLLVAQAQSEQLVVVTDTPAILERYPGLCVDARK